MTPTEPARTHTVWHPRSWISFALVVIAVVIALLLAIKTISKPDDRDTASWWAFTAFFASFIPRPL